MIVFVKRECVEALLRWADARDRRNDGHGKTGTALLREAAAELARVSREHDEAQTRIAQEAIVAGDDVPRSFYRREYHRLLREHETMRNALREGETLLTNYLVAGKFPPGSDCEEVRDIFRAALAAGSRVEDNQ